MQSKKVLKVGVFSYLHYRFFIGDAEALFNYQKPYGNPARVLQEPPIPLPSKLV